MSRFSGLPDPLAQAPAKPVTRFSGLVDALAKVTPKSGSRAARVRAERAAAAAGESGGSSRLAAHQALKGDFVTNAAARKATGAAPAPAPTVAPRAATAAPPKPAPMAVPAHVEARGEVYANAYRAAFALSASRLRRLGDMPAAKGRVGAMMTMIAEGMTDEEIAGKLPSAKTDRQTAIDSTWDRAIAQVFGTGGDIAAHARGGRADAAWDQAIAAVCT